MKVDVQLDDILFLVCFVYFQIISIFATETQTLQDYDSISTKDHRHPNGSVHRTDAGYEPARHPDSRDVP